MTSVGALRARLNQPIGKQGRPSQDSPAAKHAAVAGRRTLGRQKGLVGLDIGSTAVRAVEVNLGRGKPAISRLGQVGLPSGAVREGEVIDVEAVGRAVKELWSKVGFSSSSVTVGISGQRVMVRGATVTAMSEADFRNALQFEAVDLIPIPVDDAVMDFRILPPDGGQAGDQTQMQILLAAAHRATVASHLAAVKAGGLTATAVDVGGLALLRSLDLAGQHLLAPRAVVAIGADLTTVAVAEGSGLSFMRVLAGGGNQWAGATATMEAESLVNQVAASLDYFSSQGDLSRLERVWLTGGGSQYPPLVEQLRHTLRYDVLAADPFGQVDLEGSTLTVEELAGAAPFIQTALGLACWDAKASLRRLTLLPPEIIRARRQRRSLAMVAAAGVALVAILAGAWYQRTRAGSEVRSQIAGLEARSSVQQAKVNHLEAILPYFSAVNGREATVKLLEAGNVDWPALVNEIAGALPPGLNLSNLSFGPGTGSTTATGVGVSGASNGPPAVAKGTGDAVSMSVSGRGGEDLVAVFLRAMDRVAAFSNVWVPSASVGADIVTFTASATLNGNAPQVQRGGAK